MLTINADISQLLNTLPPYVYYANEETDMFLNLTVDNRTGDVWCAGYMDTEGKYLDGYMDTAGSPTGALQKLALSVMQKHGTFSGTNSQALTRNTNKG